VPASAPASTPVPAPNPGADAETYVKFGIANAAGGDLASAVAAFDEAIKIDPKYAPAYENRGKAKLFQYQFDEAISDFDQALQLDPSDQVAFYLRGSAKGQKGDFDGAIADFSHLIELDPKHAPAYYNRGHAKYFKGDLDGATADINQALTMDPNYPYSYFIRGLIRHAQNDRAEAISDFQKSAGFGYAYATFWVWIAQTENGQRGIAREDLSEALTKPEVFKPNDWATTLGNFLLEKVTPDELIAQAGTGNGGEDRLCEAWFYSGMFKRLSGDNKGAQDCFTKAVATGAKSCEEFVEANREMAALQNP